MLREVPLHAHVVYLLASLPTLKIYAYVHQSIINTHMLLRSEYTYAVQPCKCIHSPSTLSVFAQQKLVSSLLSTLMEEALNSKAKIQVRITIVQLQ